MTYCTRKDCTFHTSSKEYFAMHMAIDHSNLDSQRVYNLFHDLLQKLSTGSESVIQLQLDRVEFLQKDDTSAASNLPIKLAPSFNKTDKAMPLNQPLPTLSLHASTKMQRLIPNSRLNAGNLRSVSHFTYLCSNKTTMSIEFCFSYSCQM